MVVVVIVVVLVVLPSDIWVTVLLQINLGIFVNDSNMELSVLVDRAVGGSSMKDGQIELMLHRYFQISRFLA